MKGGLGGSRVVFYDREFGRFCMKGRLEGFV